MKDEIKYYIYGHFDSNGKLFYIGRGRNDRVFKKTGRSKDWYVIANNGFSVEIISENLDRLAADTLEEQLIFQFKEQLVNKVAPAKTIPILYNDVSKYFSYDENSKSCLCRIGKRFNGKGYRGNLGEVGFKTTPKSACNKQQWKVKHNNRGILIHRIIWVLNSKQDLNSNMVIDHINGNSLDNRIENLRLVTQTENTNNQVNCDYLYGKNIIWECSAKRFRIRYNNGIKKTVKNYYPHKLFPELDFESAKENTLKFVITERDKLLQNYK